MREGQGELVLQQLTTYKLQVQLTAYKLLTIKVLVTYIHLVTTGALREKNQTALSRVIKLKAFKNRLPRGSGCRLRIPGRRKHIRQRTLPSKAARSLAHRAYRTRLFLRSS